NPVRLHPADHASLPAAPFHFNPHFIGQTARGTTPHGIVARQITAAADHFLTLHRCRASVQPDLRADAPRVGLKSFQNNGDSRRNALIAVNSRGRSFPDSAPLPRLRTTRSSRRCPACWAEILSK